MAPDLIMLINHRLKDIVNFIHKCKNKTSIRSRKRGIGFILKILTNFLKLWKKFLKRTYDLDYYPILILPFKKIFNHI